MEKELHELQEGPDVDIYLELLIATLKKVLSWQAPEHDGIQEFFFKKSTSIHDSLAFQPNRCLEETNIPVRMTERKTILT